MPRAHDLQPSFNAGELSPRLAARLDFAKYGADQDEAHLGHVGGARPDLLPVDEEVVAILGGAGLETRQVTAGTRLGVALAPDDLTAHRGSERRIGWEQRFHAIIESVTV